MMLVRTLSLFIVLFIYSCSNMNKVNDFSDVDDTTDVFKPDIASHLTSSPSIVFDSIAEMPSFTKRYVVNHGINFDDSTDIDTVVEFANNADTILYAKANSGMFLWKMTLKTKLIVLDKNVFVSCKKEVLRLKLNLDTIWNNLILTGEDGGETYRFFFKNDTLNKINYEMHFDAIN